MRSIKIPIYIAAFMAAFSCKVREDDASNLHDDATQNIALANYVNEINGVTLPRAENVASFIPDHRGDYFHPAFVLPFEGRFKSVFETLWYEFKSAEVRGSKFLYRPVRVSFYLSKLNQPVVEERPRTKTKVSDTDFHRHFSGIALADDLNSIREQLRVNPKYMEKYCSPSEMSSLESVMHFDLDMIRFPRLAKPFLVLAKMGYFDRAPLRHLDGRNYLFYFGQRNLENPAFFMETGSQDTFNRLAPNVAKNSEKTKNTQPTGVENEKIRKPPTDKASQYPFGGLVGIVSTNLNNRRYARGTQFAFNLMETQEQEEQLDFKTKNDWPVVFGTSVDAEDDIILRDAVVRNSQGGLKNDLIQKHQYLVSCVGIEVLPQEVREAAGLLKSVNPKRPDDRE